MEPNFWIAFYWDFSGFACFDNKSEAYEFAQEHNMTIAPLPWGVDIRAYLWEKHRGS